MMVFSVQQVKYEFLAYIKEFDPTFSNTMACAMPKIRGYTSSS